MKINSYKLFFRALSNPARQKIVAVLRKHTSLSVNEISEKTGLEQSWASHSLKCLTECGFVDVAQKGKQRRYSLEKKTIKPLLALVDRHLAKYRARLRQCGVLEGET